MRILIENSQLIYRRDSVFKPLMELAPFGDKKHIFQKYPWKIGGRNDGRIYLKKDAIILENADKREIAKALVYKDTIEINLFNESYAFYKGEQKAFLFKEGKQVASIWLNLPYMELIDITFEANLPHEELALFILGIIRFKSGLISKKTVLEKLEESNLIDDSNDWRPKPIGPEQRLVELEQEIERLLTVKHPRELIFDDRLLVFPWLQDTLQYWGDRPIELKEKCMNHLLYLLSMVNSDYDYYNCNGYKYAQSSYNAGLYIYSPDGDWNYEPIGLALQKSDDENIITDLIDILEDSCDMELYNKYIAPLSNHPSPYVKASVFDARKKMD